MITIAIVSHNRAKYLLALLRSLDPKYLVDQGCEVIVVDNASVEKEIETALSFECVNVIRRTDTPDWINDEYIAKNIAIKAAKHKTILFLQDDMQLLFEPRALLFAAQQFEQLNVNSVSLTAARGTTTDAMLDYNDVKKYKNFVTYHIADDHICTTGFFRKELFDKVGLYVEDHATSATNWGKSEDEFNFRAHQILGTGQSYHAKVPLFASVWNDPRGGYAIMRDGKRHGHYTDPVSETGLYYKQHTINNWIFMNAYTGQKRYTFTSVASPLGWTYKTDSSGEQYKFPQKQLIVEGPSTLP